MVIAIIQLIFLGVCIFFFLDKRAALPYITGMIHITTIDNGEVTLFLDDSGNLLISAAPYEVVDIEGARLPQLLRRHETAELDLKPVPYGNLSEWVQKRTTPDTKDAFFAVRGYLRHNTENGIEVIGYIRLSAGNPASTLIGEEGWYKTARLEMVDAVKL